MSVYQWTGSSAADLGNGGNWVDTSDPGTDQPPGPKDAAIIQSGEDLYGTRTSPCLISFKATAHPRFRSRDPARRLPPRRSATPMGFTLDAGASTGNASLLLTRGGYMIYESEAASGTLTSPMPSLAETFSLELAR